MRVRLKHPSHLHHTAGFSTWHPLSGRLLWFRRAYPSTTLDKKVFYWIVEKGYGSTGFLSMQI